MKKNKKLENHAFSSFLSNYIEVRDGFEPTDNGVADRGLTTWLSHQKTPRVGFEPTTLRLTAECSAAELSRNNYSDSDGNRTRVTAVKGRCLDRLTTEP